MNFVDDCYASVISSILVIIILLIIVPVILFIKLKRKNKNYIVLMYEIIMLLLIFCVLFIPKKVENFEKVENFDLKFEKFIGSGNWTNMYKTDDPEFITKKWKGVYEFKPISSYILNQDVNTKDRNVFDLLGWKLCMAAQWENILYMEKYYNIINVVPLVKNIDEKTLSYDQEVCRKPTKEDIPLIKSSFKELNKQLEKLNMYYIDVHAQNVMINKNGQVRFIDGELVNKSNFDISTIIYKYFTKCPFMAIDNNDRIYWSNEELERRPPLDSLDHRGILMKSPYE